MQHAIKILPSFADCRCTEGIILPSNFFIGRLKTPLIFGHAAWHAHGCGPLLEVIQGGWPEDYVLVSMSFEQLLAALTADLGAEIQTSSTRPIDLCSAGA